MVFYIKVFYLLLGSASNSIFLQYFNRAIKENLIDFDFEKKILRGLSAWDWVSSKQQLDVHIYAFFTVNLWYISPKQPWLKLGALSALAASTGLSRHFNMLCS